MKKIFAIALALVMVLSMASAFAAVGGVQCYTPAYTCPTVGCGVAKAEVVQFAAVNTLDGFEETTCAGVVKGQNIFYGVKVVFDADVNEQWFTDPDTELSMFWYNVDNTKALEDHTLGTLEALTGKTYDKVSGKIFWYDFEKKALVSEWNPNCVDTVVADNTKAKVCADVDYENDGIGTWDYTNFDAKVVGAGTGYEFAIGLLKDGKQLSILVVDGVAKYATFAGDWEGETIYYADKGTIMVTKNATYIFTDKTLSGEPATVAGLACDEIDEYLALIGLKLGDCVTASTIKAIFGWDDADKFMSCKTWNKDAMAIVNSECVVMGIPKTGDVSVVAYAVMAVVAAAGAMLKK